MISSFDVQMMRRAIRLAMNGRGHVEPNPMVGCVLVKDRRVIGEGFHSKFGGPHAEPTALSACTESPHGATAYVTLEPCCHANKKTPPCVPALIEARIARAVVGCVDPNPDVNGRGLEHLRAAGIEVNSNVLEDEAKQLLAPFIARTVYQRPYVTLKWAETADGKVAGPTGARLQISNDASTRVIHQLRARSDAIAVGINTVLNDDPMLTVRGTDDLRHPARVVLDSSLRMPVDSAIARSAHQHPTWLFCSVAAYSRKAADAARLVDRGIEVIASDEDLNDRLRLLEVLIELRARDCTHVLVEPGPTLCSSFLELELHDGYPAVDRIWHIHSPTRVDDPTAPAAVGIPGDFVRTGQLNLAGDILTEYLNPHSPVFFAPVPSADLVLAMEQASR